MRLFAACIVAVGLIVLPAMAGPGGGADKDSAGSGASSPVAVSGSTAPAAAPKAEAAAKSIPASSELESELQELRDLLDSQAKQLQEQRQQMQLLEEKLNASNAVRENLSSSPADPSAIGPTPAIAANASLANAQPNQDKAGPPTSISFKGITLTPGGFMAAETAWRQHALSGDVNSPFNSVPFSGSPMDHASEFNASGRQSRISMLAEGKLDNVKIGGYYEMDFLSAGVTSNYNQSSSYTMRQRQFWAQAAFNSGWTFTGGQMWSLVTETKKGMDNRTEATPMTIDAQYNVGFSWARQFGFRVTKNFGNKVWLGFSVENPETTATFHGQNNNFLVGAPGAGGGLLNPIANYAFSAAPDFVVKAAFEPGWGHFEVFGIESNFRDRLYPCGAVSATTVCGGLVGPSGATGFNDNRAGGGIGANARVNVFKKVDLGLHFLGGDGVGRYGTASLPDLTVRPDGTIALIHSYQGLGTIELHPTPKLDVYMYVGGEYAGRTQYTKTGSLVPNEGYGAIGLNNFGCTTEQAPGSSVSTPTGVGGSAGFVPGGLTNCTGDTRNLIEGTLGFWYRFYKGSKGTVQWGPQYSYVQRNTWSGVASGTENGVAVTTNGQPHGVENMFFTSFRYVLP